MFLAVSALSPTAQFVCYFVAFVLLVVLAIVSWLPRAWPMVLLATALAFYVFVAMWQALAST